MHGPRCVPIREQLMLCAVVPLQPVVDRRSTAIGAGSVRRYFGRRAGDGGELLEAPVGQGGVSVRSGRAGRARRRSTAWSCKSTVSMMRSSVRMRRARAASSSA